MTPDSALLRILYDPVGWADLQWLVHFQIDLRWHRRLGNALLMQRAGLCPVTEAELGTQDIRWIVQHWNVLPQIVYLVGARLARNALINANAVLRLRHNAHGFLTFPLSESLWGRVSSLSDVTLWPREQLHARVFALGISCLQKAWPDLPPGWSDRLRMRLPPEAQECAAVGKTGAVLPASASCLRLFSHAVIFHHAQKN